MNIGIFGDSFAADCGPGSWVTMLGNEHTVECHAHGGTSLFHCYQTMLRTDLSAYDIVIVSVTNYGRLYGGYENDIHKPHLSGIETAMFHAKTAKGNDLDRLKAGIEYYSHLSQDDYNIYVHEKLLQDIITMVNNKLILLPAFEHSYTPTLELFVNYIESGFSLFDVSEMERKYFNVTQCIEKDTLYNHMSEENNAVLFKFLHKLILGESCSMTLSSFICPPNSKDYYYG